MKHKKNKCARKPREITEKARENTKRSLSRNCSCHSKPPGLGAGGLRLLLQSQAPHVLPGRVPGERLRHDVGILICCGNVIECNQVTTYGLSNKVLPYIEMFCSIMELEVGSDLFSSLVVNKDLLWHPCGSFDAHRGF